MAREEVLRQLIGFQQIARPARDNEVARRVRAAMCERMDVIERGDGDVKRCRAVHAPTAAVAHGGALDRVFE